MRKRASIVVAVLLGAVVSAEAAFVGPNRALDSVEALRCCEDHCDHARRPDDAARCCGFEAASDRAALRTPVPDLPLEPIVLIPGSSPPLTPSTEPRLETPPRREGRARAAPLYLENRVLRI